MSICDVPPKKIWVTFTHFWGGLGSFLPRLGRFAEYVVRRGKCGSNGESICFEGELSFRGICGLPRKMWFAAENVPYLLEGSSLANRWRGIFKQSLCFYIKGQCTQNHNEKETSLEI
jgi:hypothetical protein